MELKLVSLSPPKDTNVILGQSHFIKTVEDLHEAIVTTAPGAAFGITFCEASGPCLVRSTGNDGELMVLAEEFALRVGAGHFFAILLKNAFPINVLNRIREVPEVCNIYAATANPVQVILAETDQGRAVLGVVDGYKTKDIETDKDAEDRKAFLRKIGYKL